MSRPRTLTPAEFVAMSFHDSYELQAKAFDYITRKASAVPWDAVPDNNKRLMIAVAQDLLDRRVIVVGEEWMT